MKAIGVIPARLGSTRLAEKVLRPIAGKPMIEHVWRRAVKARRLERVIVACDDASVEACVKKFGGEAVMTSKDHPNGSSRVAEIAGKFKAGIFVNIQGDEPMMHPEAIDSLVGVLEADPKLQVVTLAVPREDEEDYLNPNVVKVVCSGAGNALYFSRSPLPHVREKDGGPLRYLKHLGIYGYRRKFLLDFVTWPVSRLEQLEKLEQLRILERGIAIRVVETPHDSFSVDTEADLQAVEFKLKGEGTVRRAPTAKG